jgi:hypothetical protein
MLHQTHEKQEQFLNDYQENLQEAKIEQLKQSKQMQDSLHLTQIEHERENSNNVPGQVDDSDITDPQTKQQKKVI